MLAEEGVEEPAAAAVGVTEPEDNEGREGGGQHWQQGAEESGGGSGGQEVGKGRVVQLQGTVGEGASGGVGAEADAVAEPAAAAWPAVANPAVGKDEVKLSAGAVGDLLLEAHQAGGLRAAEAAAVGAEGAAAAATTSQEAQGHAGADANGDANAAARSLLNGAGRGGLERSWGLAPASSPGRVSATGCSGVGAWGTAEQRSPLDLLLLQPAVPCRTPDLTHTASTAEVTPPQGPRDAWRPPATLASLLPQPVPEPNPLRPRNHQQQHQHQDQQQQQQDATIPGTAAPPTNSDIPGPHTAPKTSGDPNAADASAPTPAASPTPLQLQLLLRSYGTGRASLAHPARLAAGCPATCPMARLARAGAEQPAVAFVAHGGLLHRPGGAPSGQRTRENVGSDTSGAEEPAAPGGKTASVQEGTAHQEADAGVSDSKPPVPEPGEEAPVVLELPVLLPYSGPAVLRDVLHGLAAAVEGSGLPSWQQLASAAPAVQWQLQGHVAVRQGPSHGGVTASAVAVPSTLEELIAADLQAYSDGEEQDGDEEEEAAAGRVHRTGAGWDQGLQGQPGRGRASVPEGGPQRERHAAEEQQQSQQQGNSRKRRHSSRRTSLAVPSVRTFPVVLLPSQCDVGARGGGSDGADRGGLGGGRPFVGSAVRSQGVGARLGEGHEESEAETQSACDHVGRTASELPGAVCVATAAVELYLDWSLLSPGLGAAALAGGSMGARDRTAGGVGGGAGQGVGAENVGERRQGRAAAAARGSVEALQLKEVLRPRELPRAGKQEGVGAAATGRMGVVGRREGGGVGGAAALALDGYRASARERRVGEWEGWPGAGALGRVRRGWNRPMVLGGSGAVEAEAGAPVGGERDAGEASGGAVARERQQGAGMAPMGQGAFGGAGGGGSGVGRRPCSAVGQRDMATQAAAAAALRTGDQAEAEEALADVPLAARALKRGRPSDGGGAGIGPSSRPGSRGHAGDEGVGAPAMNAPTASKAASAAAASAGAVTGAAAATLAPSGAAGVAVEATGSDHGARALKRAKLPTMDAEQGAVGAAGIPGDATPTEQGDGSRGAQHRPVSAGRPITASAGATGRVAADSSGASGGAAGAAAADAALGVGSAAYRAPRDVPTQPSHAYPSAGHDSRGASAATAGLSEAPAVPATAAVPPSEASAFTGGFSSRSGGSGGGGNALARLQQLQLQGASDLQFFLGLATGTGAGRVAGAGAGASGRGVGGGAVGGGPAAAQQDRIGAGGSRGVAGPAAAGKHAAAPGSGQQQQQQQGGRGEEASPGQQLATPSGGGGVGVRHVVELRLPYSHVSLLAALRRAHDALVSGRLLSDMWLEGEGRGAEVDTCVLDSGLWQVGVRQRRTVS